VEGVQVDVLELALEEGDFLLHEFLLLHQLLEVLVAEVLVLQVLLQTPLFLLDLPRELVDGFLQ
jgi:hypothetical protein